MRCERCGSGIISGRTECHICGAPVAAAPEKKKEPEIVVAPAAGTVPANEIEAGIPGITMAHPNDPMGIGAPPPQPMGGGGMRVSLTGEVFEAAPAPMPIRAPSATSGPRPPAPRPGAATKGKQREYLGEDDAVPKGNPIVAILLLVVLLGAGGGGGYWWWSKKQAPARAASGMLDAAKAGNWKKVFEFVEFPPEAEQQFASAGGKDAALGIIASFISASGVKVMDYKILESKIEGETATVKVWQKVSAPGAGEKENTQELKLKLVKDVWMVDGTSMRGGGMGGMPLGQ